MTSDAIYCFDRASVLFAIYPEGSPEPRVEVGWSGSEPDGSPLLLVAGGGTLTAYRVVAGTR